MITVTQTQYKKYGNCCQISDGVRKMLVTTDVGPRIIFFGMVDGENIMFEDLNDDINKGGEFFERNLQGKGIWHIYGGHRLWKSPEYMDTYYPDNAPVDVEILDNGAIFTAQPEITTKLQKSVKVTMSKDGKVTVEHKITNVGDAKTSKIALWSLTVMDKGAKVTFALSDRDTGFLPNRNLVFWPYADYKDDRFNTDGKTVTVEWKNRPPFKIGACLDCGKISVATKGVVFTKKFDFVEGGEYPDMNSNTEVYTNELMVEVESLAPYTQLDVGESTTHVEVWTLDRA